MNEKDVIHFAKAVLRITNTYPEAMSYPLPLKRVRGLCEYVIDASAEKRGHITEKESEILSALQSDCEEGITPTIKSIACRLGYKKTNIVKRYINTLTTKGHLYLDDDNNIFVTL